MSNHVCLDDESNDENDSVSAVKFKVLTPSLDFTAAPASGNHDLLEVYGLKQDYRSLCQKPLPNSAQKHLRSVRTGDTVLRRGEGMELSQLISRVRSGARCSSSSGCTRTPMVPFPREVLLKAFTFETGQTVCLSEEDKGPRALPEEDSAYSEGSEIVDNDSEAEQVLDSFQPREHEIIVPPEDSDHEDTSAFNKKIDSVDQTSRDTSPTETLRNDVDELTLANLRENNGSTTKLRRGTLLPGGPREYEVGTNPPDIVATTEDSEGEREADDSEAQSGDMYRSDSDLSSQGDEMRDGDTDEDVDLESKPLKLVLRLKVLKPATAVPQTPQQDRQGIPVRLRPRGPQRRESPKPRPLRSNSWTKEEDQRLRTLVENSKGRPTKKLFQKIAKHMRKRTPGALHARHKYLTKNKQ